MQIQPQTQTYIFDRIRATGIQRLEALPDGDAFLVSVGNFGGGRPEKAQVRVEATGTAQNTCGNVDDWICNTVEWIANLHENDGEKLSALLARQPLRLDSQYVVN